MTEMTMPFQKMMPFMCGHSLIQPTDIEHIKIVETEATSSTILKKTKWQRITRKIIGTLGESRSEDYYRDEWFVFHAGKDVTRDFVKGFSLPKAPSRAQTTGKNVFIVHGRDHTPMKELQTMLYEFGLKPIILHEKASEGSLTLAEKLEEYSKDVGYAFVILTPDDVGCQETEVEKLKSKLKAPILRRPKLVTPYKVEQLFKRFQPRARQNVIFEMGYFWGLLERKRVCCLLKGDVEKPSDIKGIVYIRFKNSIKDVQVEIMKKLTKAKYKIKM